MSLANWLQLSRRWHIEHGDQFSNHLSHNMVVMSLAGAPNERLQEWYEYYTKRLLPATTTVDYETITIDNWNEHNGSSTAYAAFLRFFDQRIQVDGADSTIQQYLPTLLPGIAGALLHPIIHIGLAIDAQSDGMLAEGLAYMAFANERLDAKTLPIWTPSSSEKSSIIESSVRFLAEAKRKSLYEIVVGGMEKKMANGETGGITLRMLSFVEERVTSDTLDAIDLQLPLDLLPAIIDATTLVAAAYLGSNCEFVVVHGVTSLHGVLRVLPKLLTLEERCDALAHWWRALMIVMVAQNLPGLDEIMALANEWLSRRSNEVSVPSNSEWQALLEASWSSDDEHVQKGVYCMWQWATRIDGMPARSKELFYRAAKNQVRPHPTGELGKWLWNSYRKTVALRK